MSIGIPALPFPNMQDWRRQANAGFRTRHVMTTELLRTPWSNRDVPEPRMEAEAIGFRISTQCGAYSRSQEASRAGDW